VLYLCYEPEHLNKDAAPEAAAFVVHNFESASFRKGKAGRCSLIDVRRSGKVAIVKDD
jgi:hypothetical protein